MLNKSTPLASNLVAKHARTYNKAHTFTDRKKAAKAGKRKHRGGWE